LPLKNFGIGARKVQILFFFLSKVFKYGTILVIEIGKSEEKKETEKSESPT